MANDGITFRTNDNTRWGTGAGMDLTATQIDMNFWVLYTAIVAIQDHLDTSASIASISVVGNQMTVLLTNNVALGPFTLPTATFNFRGDWQAHQAYNVNDLFRAPDPQFGTPALWITTYNVLDSGSTFNPYANDGAGHNWWAEVIAGPAPELPADGTPGQFLQMQDTDSPASVAWVNINRNIGIYVENEPNPLEVVARYIFTEKVIVPQGATGSRASAATAPTSTQMYELLWNGANIGYVTFTVSPDEPSFTFPHEVIFEPGDVFTVVAPSVPDPHLTGIAITLVGALSL